MLDLLIVSFGGTGCSYLNQYLSKNTPLKINNLYDFDKMKHMPLTENTVDNFNQAKKIIFLTNDPLLAIQSHFRRGWGVYQSQKLGNPYRLNLRMQQSDYIKEVLRHKKDVFGVEHQFDSIITQKGRLKRPLLFIDFRKIEQSIEMVAKFLEIDQKFLVELKIKPRNCTNDGLPKEYIEIYKKLDNKMAKYHGITFIPTTPQPRAIQPVQQSQPAQHSRPVQSQPQSKSQPRAIPAHQIVQKQSKRKINLSSGRNTIGARSRSSEFDGQTQSRSSEFDGQTQSRSSEFDGQTQSRSGQTRSQTQSRNSIRQITVSRNRGGALKTATFLVRNHIKK